MENDENLKNEAEMPLNPEESEKPQPEITADKELEALPSDVSEGNGNLDICPNCLEPNTDDLAVCKYCGMPLHQGADPDEYLMKAEAENLEANRAEAVPEEPKKPAKKEENGFRRVMPWLGLYIIYYAITGIIETSHQEDLENPKLAYASWIIYIIAGVMLAWPLFKKGYRKLRHLPDPDEIEEEEDKTSEENTSESDEEQAAGENHDDEVTEELPAGEDFENKTEEDHQDDVTAEPETEEKDEQQKA